MATKISEMTDASTPLTGSELIEIVQSSNTRKTPISEITDPYVLIDGTREMDKLLIAGDIINSAHALIVKNTNLGGEVMLKGTGNPDPPEYISSADYASGAGVSSFVCDKPAGIIESDLMVASFTVEINYDLINSVPEGWTKLFSQSNNSNNMHFVYYKLANTEPGNYTWGFDASSQDVAGGIMSFRHVDPNTPIGDWTVQNGQNGQVIAQSIDTISDNELVLHIASMQYGYGGMTEPVDYTEAFERWSKSASTGVTSEASFKTYAAPGATGAKSTQAVPVGSGYWVGAHIALCPNLSGEAKNVITCDPDGAANLCFAGVNNFWSTAEGGETRGGLKFPASQVPSSDPNTIDDCEKGNWTPELADAVSGGNLASLGTSVGTYTKTGRIVNIIIAIFDIDTGGMTAGNVLYLRKLPFTSISTISESGAAAPRLSEFTFSGYVTSYITANSTILNLYEIVTGTVNATLKVSSVDGPTSDMFLSLSYTTNV
jgi:hypothetical protein